jgi:pyridoxine 5-phosphate synthase
MRRKLGLGVNIDHVASLRQARGTTYPDVVQAARDCEDAGADGITVHLREDRRHIQDEDVYALRKTIGTHLNLEMANTPEIVEIALDVKPDEVCLVPEKREELTTEGGLNVAGQMKQLAGPVEKMINAGIEVSLFIEADKRQIRAAAQLGSPYIELHTGTFCDAIGKNAKRELDRLIDGAIYAHELGLEVNAGHGINLENLEKIMEIPHLDTLNIGHSIVARAIFVGMKTAVREMRARMTGYTGGRHA